MKKTRKNNDILSKKIAELDKYASDYNNAVSIVHNTVHRLETLGNAMDETIAEIEAYQAGLEETKQNVKQERDRTTRIIGNFKSLLEE